MNKEIQQREQLKLELQQLKQQLVPGNMQIEILVKAHTITKSLTDLEKKHTLPENWEILKTINVLKAVIKQLSELEEKL